ncbi:MAG: hypothetical protein K9N49_07435, partial [Candidatus Marinimicrobia bacterium]|nr:hypothetical protein [Candidatus Neomarinimicrobiota bacterium]
ALRADFENRLAPDGNALVWATGQVTTVARAASLPVESISEVRLPLPPWERPQRKVAQPGDEGNGATRAADRPRKRVFRPYAVEVVFNGGFHALLRFMAAIESNALLQVVGISIAAEEQTPEQHRMRLILQWLTYTDAPLPLEAP